MARINLTMGFKGGIGKTTAAVCLTLYLLEINEKPPICIDLDWKNHSFSKFKALDVIAPDLETDGDVEKRKFDLFIEQIVKADPDDVFVIDCGSNTYSPLNNYMTMHDVPNMLLELGQELLCHVPISGGSDLVETVATFVEVAEDMPEAAPIAIWLNPFHGVIEQHGKIFEEFAAYLEHKDRVRNIVTIPKMPEETKQDLAEMFKSRRVFNEAIADASLPIMNRQRLSRAYKLLKDAIVMSGVCE